jgi:hypothetical protein
MTEAEARALADQRNRHKSKHQTHVTWTAQHDSVKGWRAVLVPVAPPPVPPVVSGSVLLVIGEIILRERVLRALGKL